MSNLEPKFASHTPTTTVQHSTAQQQRIDKEGYLNAPWLSRLKDWVVFEEISVYMR